MTQQQREKNYTYGEAAIELDIPVETVKAILKRNRGRIPFWRYTQRVVRIPASSVEMVRKFARDGRL